MIDLDELQAAINRCEFDGDVLGLSKAECSDLLGRLRQAEKDAARYRWLRDEAIEHQDNGPLIVFSDFNGEPCSFGDGGSIISHDDADRAIDEAMQCK